jgi:hypothetical protein
MLAHLFGKGTKPNTREVIDREASVFRVIQREHASTQCLDFGVHKPFFESRQTHALRDFLHHDLDKDAA